MPRSPPKASGAPRKTRKPASAACPPPRPPRRAQGAGLAARRDPRPPGAADHSLPPRAARRPAARPGYRCRRARPRGPRGGTPPPPRSHARPPTAARRVGDLAPWMDESFLYNIFVSTQQLVSVKLIRNRATGQSEGASIGPSARPRQGAAAACGVLEPSAAAPPPPPPRPPAAARPQRGQAGLLPSAFRLPLIRPAAAGAASLPPAAAAAPMAQGLCWLRWRAARVPDAARHLSCRLPPTPARL